MNETIGAPKRAGRDGDPSVNYKKDLNQLITQSPWVDMRQCKETDQIYDAYFEGASCKELGLLLVDDNFSNALGYGRVPQARHALEEKGLEGKYINACVNESRAASVEGNKEWLQVAESVRLEFEQELRDAGIEPNQVVSFFHEDDDNVSTFERVLRVREAN